MKTLTRFLHLALEDPVFWAFGMVVFSLWAILWIMHHGK
jgi:hypothetical protein